MAFSQGGFGRSTVKQRIDALMPSADVILPPGAGPFPVVVQLHGCGGKKPFQADWAEVARAAGWAVVILDSHKPRHISQIEAYALVCTGLQLWGRERAGDLYAALEWARAQPWADSQRLAVAGWSHGGWTALDGLAMAPGGEIADATGLGDLPAEPLAGLVGAFLVYPFAGPGSLARQRGLRVDVRAQALVGTRDVIVGGRSLARTLAGMPTPGAPIDIIMLEGATHAFDERDNHDFRVNFDSALTARAHACYHAYLSAAAQRASSIRVARRA